MLTAKEAKAKTDQQINNRTVRDLEIDQISTKVANNQDFINCCIKPYLLNIMNAVKNAIANGQYCTNISEIQAQPHCQRVPESAKFTNEDNALVFYVGQALKELDINNHGKYLWIDNEHPFDKQNKLKAIANGKALNYINVSDDLINIIRVKITKKLQQILVGKYGYTIDKDLNLHWDHVSTTADNNTNINLPQAIQQAFNTSSLRRNLIDIQGIELDGRMSVAPHKVDLNQKFTGNLFWDQATLDDNLDIFYCMINLDQILLVDANYEPIKNDLAELAHHPRKYLKKHPEACKHVVICSGLLRNIIARASINRGHAYAIKDNKIIDTGLLTMVQKHD